MNICCDTSSLFSNADRHADTKNQLEAAAINDLLKLHQQGKIRMLRSHIIRRELERTRGARQRDALFNDFLRLVPVANDEKVLGFDNLITDSFGGSVTNPLVSDVQDENLVQRLRRDFSLELEDAQHLAQAISNDADVFLTRDEEHFIKQRLAIESQFSTVDQHPETQLSELRQFAANKGFQVIGEYIDRGYCGARARRPELDRMMDDARRHKFDVVLVWACDRLARSTKHLLQTIDELNGMGVQFLSQREAIDTEGPLGRAILFIVSAMAELERCMIIERVRAGMRRARLEGRQIGRMRLDVNREQVIRDRLSGMSLTQVAKKHGISRASVCRLMKEATTSPNARVAAFPVSMPEQASAAGAAQ